MKRERGQALIEFAIVMPLIALLVFGIFDLGRGVFAFNTLAQAARQASRTAIVDQRPASVVAAAVAAAPTLGLSSSNVTVCFKTSDSTQTNCNSLTTDNCPESTRTLGCLAIVKVSLTYTPMTPILSTILPSIPLSSTSIQAIEYVCPYPLHTTCP